MITKSSRLALAEANNMVSPGSDSYTLTAGVLHLFKDGPTPTPSTPLSAYTECDYTGYPVGGVSVTFGVPIVEGDGSYTAITGSKEFRGSGTTTANNVQGMFLTFGNDSLTVACAEKFADEIPIAADGQGFVYVASLNAGSPAANSEGTIIQ